MSKVISKTIKLKVDKFPPSVDFIEQEIEKQGLEALRWAIVDVVENELVLSCSGRILNETKMQIK